MVSAPSGTVTFLFTDIQGSTRLWQEDPSAMDTALRRHDEILRKSISLHEGHVFKTVGDAFCCAFAEAIDAIRAAIAVQLVLREEHWGTPRPIRVRMSIHTGTARERDNDYFGPPVNKVARIESLAHGGQVVMSRATAELVRDLLPDGISLEDKGSHRLKDLARPEDIFQIIHPDLPSDFPPLKSMDVLPNNLPVQSTPLIGRERELQAVREIYGKNDCRLVSLVGPGGMGKTRLSLQLAAEMIDENSDGTWFVDLTTITQPQGVALETGRVLAIPQDTEIDPVEQVARVLADKNLLIVLDNFEQVMSAYSVVVEWMKRSPDVRFLVTSREPLNIRGEYVYHVPPLSLPNPGGGAVLSQFEATRLFIDRACASKPDFTVNNDNAPVVAEICSRLDGIPLAIELAAARIRLLNPKAILKRLDTRLKILTGGPNDMPDRHKTLRACIDWSYDLLAEKERAIYRGISVFSGGISLPSAIAVLEPVEDELEILEGLESLVDKSLIYRKAPLDDEPFFGILETIGEYGRQRLIEAEEDKDFLDRHAGYFLSLVMNAKEAWDGPEQKRWIDRITANDENIRHSMNRFIESGEGKAAVSMTKSLVPFWIMRSEYSVCREWIWSSLDHCSDTDREDAAWLTMQMGWLSWAASNYSEAEHYLDQALVSFKDLSDEAGIANTMLHLAETAFFRGDFEKADGICSGELASISDIPRITAARLRLLGNIESKRNHLEKARRFHLEALDSYVSGGNDINVAIINNNLGTLAYLEGSFDAASEYYGKALPIFELYDHYQYLRYTLSNLGELALAEGDFDNALAMFEKVKNKSVFKLDHRYTACSFVGISEAYFGKGDHELSEHCALEAIDLVRSYGDTIEMGMAHRVLGEIRIKEGKAGEAIEYFESAIRILSDLNEFEEVDKARKGLEFISGNGGSK